MMSRFFTGTIDRLIVVAGHSGSGKTTFLRNSKQLLNVEQYPQHLTDFHSLTPSHVDIMQLRGHANRHFDNLCLHVDISQPIRWWRPVPRDRAGLKKIIQPTMYTMWPELNQYLKQAKQLDIVTYLVDREVHFSRWAYNKGFRYDDGGDALRLIASVCGDSTSNSELHRRVYQAWLAYAQSLSPRSMAAIDGNTDNYSFLTNSALRRKLEP